MTERLLVVPFVTYKTCILVRVLLFCVCVLTFVSDGVYACTICIPYPTRTATDELVQADTVVLARENPDKPWSFIVVEALKGDPGKATAINQFLNSFTRRMLQLYPERGVVFARGEGAKSNWRSLGFADKEFENVVRKIILMSPRWKILDQFDQERLDFFAPYLGHKNRRLHELAYVEIGRAPYSAIKKLPANWSRKQIRLLLKNPVYLEWFPLAILMLAHTGTPDDQRFIRQRSMSHMHHRITVNLSAWATALIEIDGEDAVEVIEKQYFRSSNRTKAELKAVTAALSEHGNDGHIYLRDRIVQSYSALLDTYPNMANLVTQDLIKWQRWELSKKLSDILVNPEQTDPLNAYAIKLYLSRSTQSLMN